MFAKKASGDTASSDSAEEKDSSKDAVAAVSLDADVSDAAVDAAVTEDVADDVDVSGDSAANDSASVDGSSDSSASGSSSHKKKNVSLEPVDWPTVERVCREFLDPVFQAMGIEVTIDVAFDDESNSLLVDLSGPNMGLIIGKRGQTLDSLQYLTNLVVNKKSDSYVRVKMDTEDYRGRRKATLENLAKNVAFKVKRSKRAVSLEPMNPYERRVIHTALQNDSYVTTYSEGNEPYRHVVVDLK